jgi:hypothetical protein
MDGARDILMDISPMLGLTAIRMLWIEQDLFFKIKIENNYLPGFSQI